MCTEGKWDGSKRSQEKWLGQVTEGLTCSAKELRLGLLNPSTWQLGQAVGKGEPLPPGKGVGRCARCTPPRRSKQISGRTTPFPRQSGVGSGATAFDVPGSPPWKAEAAPASAQSTQGRLQTHFIFHLPREPRGEWREMRKLGESTPPLSGLRGL